MSAQPRRQQAPSPNRYPTDYDRQQAQYKLDEAHRAYKRRPTQANYQQIRAAREQLRRTGGNPK